MLGIFPDVFSSADISKIVIFSKILIWVLTVFRGYQQTTLVGKYLGFCQSRHMYRDIFSKVDLVGKTREL